MLNRLPEAQWSRLSEVIAETIGLHFPPERRADLQRALVGTASELGFEDLAACAEQLLSTPPTKAQLQVLASHLTIGETYFFRDKQTLAALAEHILPELIRDRRGRNQRLRIWSAACCTGEEPYSLAILLQQRFPDLRDWHVTITATDINARFLRKAAAGVYGEWSFRDTPAWLKERYFERTADGRFALVPEIRKRVTFEHLNLVEDVYPSLTTQTNAMDLVLCRNVLMYFTPPQVRKVIGNLHHVLVEGGWLAVGPSEASHTLFPRFLAVDFPGAILYRKSGEKPQAGVSWAPAPPGEAGEFAKPVNELPSRWAAPVPGPSPTEPLPSPEAPAPAGTSPRSWAVAESHFQAGRYAEAADTLLAALAECPPDPAAFSLLARTLANQGKLAEALAWCERWIAADKLDPAGHYLLAVVLLEQGDPGQARASLQRTLYLEPDFVLAHFALGELARSRGKFDEAEKHFANALQLLRRYQPDDLLPESDGLTAGRLAETLASMTSSANSP